MKLLNRSILFVLSSLLLFACSAVSPVHAQQYAQPGKFDFYLFTLSWSPQFCATDQRDSAECHVPSGNFVVHGLWPEFKNGSWPSECSQERGPSNPSSESDVMPPSLVRHEWQKHGTCSGLGADQYFDTIRAVKKSIAIPPAFLHLTEARWIAPSEVKASFIAANSQLTADDLRIGCANNNLVEVKICVAKDGKPTGCGTIRDCRAMKIKVLPVLP